MNDYTTYFGIVSSFFNFFLRFIKEKFLPKIPQILIFFINVIKKNPPINNIDIKAQITSKAAFLFAILSLLLSIESIPVLRGINYS